MALYIPHSIFHLARLLYVRPETFGPYYVRYCEQTPCCKRFRVHKFYFHGCLWNKFLEMKMYLMSENNSRKNLISCFNINVIFSLRNSGTWELKTLSGCWIDVAMHLPYSTTGNFATGFLRFLLQHSWELRVGLQFPKFLPTFFFTRPSRFKFISIKPPTLKITKLLFFSDFSF